MASDCYEVFKDTYHQAVTDGLATAVATAAAQTAMQDCLAKQASKPSTLAVPFTSVASGRKIDPGPAKPERK